MIPKKTVKNNVCFFGHYNDLDTYKDDGEELF